MEEVETHDSNICDIIILPPTSFEQKVIDEADDDGALDQHYRPDECHRLCLGILKDQFS